MRRGVVLALAMVCASQAWGGHNAISSAHAATGTTPSTANAATAAGASLVADRLVDLAYARSRDDSKQAAAETFLLLQLAHQVDSKNLHTARLLADAAARVGDAAIHKNALRDVITLDAEDLVAQVTYLDLLATASQAVDVRAKVYRAAFDQASFHPQIRSVMAQRLAQIAYERGDRSAASSFLQQALSLNSVNLDALRLAVMLSRNDAERTIALVTLLKANPYQPEAWKELARLAERSHLHTQAAAFLSSALEQNEIRATASGEEFLDWAIQTGIAGRNVEALAVLNDLQKVPDVPLPSMAAQMLIMNIGTTTKPAATAPSTAPATSQPDEVSVSSQLEQRLVDSVAKQPRSIDALAAALWIELSVLPKSSATHIGKWFKQLESLAGNEDEPLLGRLRGWNQLASGDTAGAIETLTPLQSDPYASLGLAKALIAEGKNGQAAQLLQTAWNSTAGDRSTDTGVQLLNLQLTLTARNAGITLAPAAAIGPLQATLAQIPPNLIYSHRRPSDIELVLTSMDDDSYALGRPMTLTVQITNTSNTPLSVGNDGAIKTTMGVLAKIAGLQSANLGLVGVESLQRVFRLDPRESTTAKIRIDQGTLADYLWSHPLTTISLNLNGILQPRGEASAPVPGLGGQPIAMPGVMRSGTSLPTLKAFSTLLTQMADQHDAELMKSATIIGASIGRDWTSPSVDPKDAADLSTQITSTLIRLLSDGDANVRAWTVMAMPTGVDETPPLKDALAKLAEDSSAIVRIAWAEHIAAYADKKSASQQLQTAAGTAPSGILQEYLKLRATDLH